jgi:O-antigen/teichoic acid export membrane protein
MTKARGRVAENVALTVATQIVSWGLSFLVTLFLPSYLQEDGLGAVTLATAFAGICTVLVILGTSSVLVKDVARHPERAPELLRAALVLRTLLSIPACAIGMIGTVVMGYDAQLQLLIFLALCVVVVTSLAETFTCVLQGLEEFRPLSVAFLVERLMFSGLTIALIFAKAPLWTFVSVGAVGSIVSFVMQWVVLRRHFRTHPSMISALEPGEPVAHSRRILGVETRMLRHLAMEGMPFFTTGLFMNVYGNAAPLILSRLSTLGVIGWFGIAKRLGGTTLILPLALTRAMLPGLARGYQRDPEEFRSAVSRMIRILLVCAMPFAAILALLPGTLLSLMRYPESYNGAIPVLSVLGVSIVFWYLSQGTGCALVASDRQAIFSKVTGVAAAVSLPLCAGSIYLTERWMNNGAVGAMVSDVVLEAGMVYAYLRFLPKGSVRLSDFGVVPRACVAIAPTVAVLMYFGTTFDFRDVAHLALLALALLLYLPLCWATRCFSADDTDQIRQILLRVFRRRPVEPIADPSSNP